MSKKIIFADDAKESTRLLVRLRLPTLIIGLMLGFGVSFFVSRFEEVISKNVALAFFIPLILYIAAAVGTQTETIYVRNLKKPNTNFKRYFIKESLVGLIVGALFGGVASLMTLIWLKDPRLSLTIGISMAIAIATAPIVALIIASSLYKFHEDPAVGAGPFTTLTQDFISLIIYLLVANLILLS